MAQQKILYVVNNIDWFWSHRLPLAAGARAAGYDVGVVVTGAENDSQLGEHGFRAIELPAMDKNLGPMTVLKTIAFMHKTLQHEKPDIMHVITIKYAFLAGLASLLHPHVKMVHLIAGLGFLFSADSFRAKMLRFFVIPFLSLALRRKNSTLIFQNPDDMRIFLERGLASREQCHLIRGSGVDTKQFSPQPDKEQADPPIVVMPTRLVKDKGVSVFVEAARILKERGVVVDMQVAGGITAYNPLAISKDEMEEMVADGAATWLGRVSDMPDLLARAAMVAYPSHYREGIPKVLLEAAAMGKAIITTDHPGCREAVIDGENGKLVPVRDPVALADAIEELLKDKSVRDNMGAQSRKRALEEFDAEIIVRETLALYQ
jgi:glycosyltransferase involved in cell wall biosynthesis